MGAGSGGQVESLSEQVEVSQALLDQREEEMRELRAELDQKTEELQSLLEERHETYVVRASEGTVLLGVWRLGYSKQLKFTRR